VPSATTRPRRKKALSVRAWQLGIVVVAVAAWQFLPQVGALRQTSPVFDPFFVSSPRKVAVRIFDMATGHNGTDEIWPYLWQSLESMFLGVLIGTVLGAGAGLLLSNSPYAKEVVSPFISFFSSAPRIAFVPIFVIIAGPTTTASVLTTVLVIFFLVFYNAYSGGDSVPLATIQNARLLGATRIEVMLRIRLPYVLVWTFASIPNAISFGLVAVVTAEILTGNRGMGRLLFNSISQVDSTLTFTVVLYLSVIGVALVAMADALRKRVLHWWDTSAGR
jgi:NitT/TauT family transport system permease protein